MINFNTFLWKDTLLIQEIIDKRIEEWEARYEQRFNHLMTVLNNSAFPEIDSELYIYIKRFRTTTTIC